MQQLVLCEQMGHTALITLNRPKALNALNAEVLSLLVQILERLDREPIIRTVILTGAGEKAFAAGADITAMQNMTNSEARSFSIFGQRVMSRIANMKTIVIAAVNGYALGAAVN